jgi:hypothetical protein
MSSVGPHIYWYRLHFNCLTTVFVSEINEQKCLWDPWHRRKSVWKIRVGLTENGRHLPLILGTILLTCNDTAVGQTPQSTDIRLVQVGGIQTCNREVHGSSPERGTYNRYVRLRIYPRWVQANDDTVTSGHAISWSIFLVTRKGQIAASTVLQIEPG